MSVRNCKSNPHLRPLVIVKGNFITQYEISNINIHTVSKFHTEILFHKSPSICIRKLICILTSNIDDFPTPESPRVAQLLKQLEKFNIRKSQL